MRRDDRGVLPHQCSQVAHKVTVRSLGATALHHLPILEIGLDPLLMLVDRLMDLGP